MVDLGHLSAVLFEIEPVLEVVSEVVTHEWTHGHRVVHNRFSLVFGSSSCFGLETRPDEDSVFPGLGFEDKRNSSWTTTSEDDGFDGNSLWAFPVWMDDGTLSGRSSETRVGMSSDSSVSDLPLLSQPVDHLHVLQRNVLV